MHIATPLYILGILLMLKGGTMLIPLGVSLGYGDGEHWAFISSFLVTFSTGFLLWLTLHYSRGDLRIRDGFLIVVLFWSVLSLFSTLPFMIAHNPRLDFVHALFEATSGLTTTGATVLTGLNDMPKSILYYRQQLHFLGGMSIIVLAVAVLPMLGIGGMQILRAEMTGPVKDNKLTPRIAQTAKAFWYIYLGLTILCTFAYWIAGMNLFDAIGHAYSTVATGGFSTYDQSIGYFNSPLIEAVAIVFMFVGSINFALHYFAMHRGGFSVYGNDPELKTFVGILLVSTLIIVAILIGAGTFPNHVDAVRYGLFQVVSAATTTGFLTTNFSTWPSFIPVLVLFIALIGGCAASTAGGFKVIRCLLLHKQGFREIERLIHPNGMFRIKLGNQVLPDSVINSIWAYFATFTIVYVILLLVLIAMGLDHLNAFAALTACLSNFGPGLYDVAEHYADVNEGSKYVLVLAMLLGRLEIFSLLVLFTPTFWRS